MKKIFLISVPLCLCGLLFFAAQTSVAQTIPAPKDILGFTPGDDRKLASWASIVDYFKKLDAASDRVMFEEIGKSTIGAPFVYATISSPENLRNLEKYKQINAKLADPRKLTGAQASPLARDAVAKRLIAQGKTIVLITCGIHSTEVGSTLTSMTIAHQLAMADHPDIKKILDNTIILLVPSLNPDGVDIVKNWYDKTLGTPYEGTEPPELYHKYVGHDNNRDWYAFTQVETQLTVDKIHNVWHPQIVHDIHQQATHGARLFLPPYMPPVEPNVPKQIVEGYTELGNYVADKMRLIGFKGVTTGTTYDAWTPARAYSHYHGGVRILSEVASAKLASPITVKFEDLRTAAGGLDAKVESPNFSPLWRGGEWKLRNITEYMHFANLGVMFHAAENREKWLSRFYEIGKEAVRPRKDGEFKASILPPTKTNEEMIGRLYLLEMLQRGGVTIVPVDPNKISSQRLRNYIGLVVPGVSEKRNFMDFTLAIPMDQPYAAFAKTLLENQIYPNLLTDGGEPIQPYDVTAHSLSLLTGISSHPLPETYELYFGKLKRDRLDLKKFKIDNPGFAIYHSHVPTMDEGWTRWLFEHKYLWESKPKVSEIQNGEISGAPITNLSSIIFPDQSPNQILNGYAKGSMPDGYTGGVGKEGVENLKKFVEAGGTLVFLNRSSQFAIEQFNLPIRDVTKGLSRKDFYIPGSILRTELDLTHPLAKGMPQQSIAWFENSPAFEIQTDPLALSNNFRIIATYPKDPKKILLSGWALGAEKIAGKAALVEFTIGKGKIVLFGFRPQYRGQSLATFPLLFNAISN